MRVAANGIHLECEERGPGDGPALILIRGLGSQLVHWPEELTGGFAASGYRVVVFDNRDAGLSARCPAPWAEGEAVSILADLRAGRVPRPAYRLDDMARDVTGLMDALAIARAHVLGISMGGVIAQHLACDHADRLLSATIVMSSARLGALGLGERLISRAADRAEYVQGWVEGHRDWGSPGYPAPESYLRTQANRAFDRGAEAAGANRQLLAILNAPDRRAALRAIALPCLVIHGAEDTLIGPAEGREVARLIPAAELDIIPGMAMPSLPRSRP